MLAAIISTILILALTVAIVLFFVRRKSFRKKILPQQIKLIKSLSQELQATKFTLEFQDEYFDRPLRCNLFDIASFIDGKHRLSKEKYDDHKLYFASDKSNLFDFEKYFNSADCPNTIKEELKAFHNEKFVPVKEKNQQYFKILIAEDILMRSVTSENQLFEGNDEVYDSWLDLKEHAHSLCYVIEQWISENTEEKILAPAPRFEELLVD